MGDVVAIRAEIQRLEREVDLIESRNCTGLAAAWCPVCGDCVCPERENALDDPDCPLHAPTSFHAEGVRRGE